MSIFNVNIRRTLLIAKRDYFGYIKTWGFWLSFFMPVIIGGITALIMISDIDLSPVRYEAIYDETGDYKEKIIAAHQRDNRENFLAAMKPMLSDEQMVELETIVTTKDFKAGTEYLNEIFPSNTNYNKLMGKTIFVDPPSNNLQELKEYVSGKKDLVLDGKKVKLSGFLHIYNNPELITDYWSTNFNNPPVINIVDDFFSTKAQNDYLGSAGLSFEDYQRLRNKSLKANIFDPSKIDTGDLNDQAITGADRLPFIFSAVLSIILWLTIFSGSYMLLTSMLEEKLNKLMEMMLASARFSEIILGKLLGVAALTFTSMLPYVILGLVGIFSSILLGLGGPNVSEAIQKTFTLKMVSFFIIFLILGYVFYGAFFIAMGALAESMQDAQTLTTPVTLLLTACMFIIPLGLDSPDSSLLAFLSWFPLSAPFAAIIRLPSDPPLWELLLSSSILALTAFGVILLAERIFRFGVLSGSGVKGSLNWIKNKILRRKTF